MTLRSTRRAGFTLVEQMVAIASVAVVAAIVTPMLIGQINKAEVRRLHSDLQALEKGTQRFRTETGAWSGAVSDLLDVPSAEDADVFGSPYASSVSNVWDGPYFEPKHLTETGQVISATGAVVEDEILLASWAPDGGSKSNYLVLQLEGVALEDAESIRLQFEGLTEVQSTGDVLTDDDLGRVRWDSTVCGGEGEGETAPTGCTAKIRGRLYYLVGPAG